MKSVHVHKPVDLRGRKTIAVTNLYGLAFANSDKIPGAVVMLTPRRFQFVGIGWIEVGEPHEGDVVVVEDPK